MIPARDCAPRALGEMLRGQPLSKAKIRFAWHTSVGASMARATSVELDPTGTLYVRTDSEHWRRETIRSAGVIKQRLAALLGQHIVKRVTVKARG